MSIWLSPEVYDIIFFKLLHRFKMTKVIGVDIPRATTAAFPI